MALIDPILLKSELGLLTGRFDVDSLESCDSTNSELMRRADAGAPVGTVIVADAQSAGRGRRGRSWLSAPETSLTFSILWRFPGPLPKLSGLSLAIGVGLARGLEKLGAEGIFLKWPNDVLLQTAGDFSKLAGILVELSADRRGVQAIIGIGLNLQPPAGDLPQVAGLSQAVSRLPDRHRVLASILSELHAVFESFAVNGFSGVQPEWQQRHAWQGDSVQILSENAEPIFGQCLGVDQNGALLLETQTGVQTIYAGDVSLRRQ